MPKTKEEKKSDALKKSLRVGAEQHGREITLSDMIWAKAHNKKLGKSVPFCLLPIRLALSLRDNRAQSHYLENCQIVIPK